jgi:hypothetical protein
VSATERLGLGCLYGTEPPIHAGHSREPRLLQTSCQAIRLGLRVANRSRSVHRFPGHFAASSSAFGEKRCLASHQLGIGLERVAGSGAISGALHRKLERAGVSRCPGFALAAIARDENETHHDAGRGLPLATLDAGAAFSVQAGSF